MDYSKLGLVPTGLDTKEPLWIAGAKSFTSSQQDKHSTNNRHQPIKSFNQ